jgi:hypothetical protein
MSRVKELEKVLSDLLDAMTILGPERIVLRPVTDIHSDGTVSSQPGSTSEFPRLEQCRRNARAILNYKPNL